MIRRQLLDPTVRPKFLAAMGGNPGWFARMRGDQLDTLFAQEDSVVDQQVLPYLVSQIGTALAEVVEIAHGLVDRGGTWINRAAWIASNIRDWKALRTVDLFERIAHGLDSFLTHQFFVLTDIAKSHPISACRLIRRRLDLVLTTIRSKKTAGAAPFLSLNDELEHLNSGTFFETLKVMSQEMADAFLEALVPWLEEVLKLTSRPRENGIFFGSDDLSFGWQQPTYAVQYSFIRAFESSLVALRKRTSQLSAVRRPGWPRSLSHAPDAPGPGLLLDAGNPRNRCLRIPSR